MTFKRKLKQKVFSLSKIKPVNMIILGTYSLLRPIAPDFLKKFYSRFPVNGKVRSQLNGSKEFIMLSDGSDTIANRIYWVGIDSYEHLTISIFPKLLQKAHVFFDIGANTGIYSLIAAAQNNNIEVHSFEPVDIIYKALERNIKASNFLNVVTNEIALCDFNGESEFNLQSVNDPIIPLGSSLRKDMGEASNMRIIKVKTQTLDSYVNEHNIQNIDIMKVDTEGTEDKVFEGGADTIEKFRPVVICEVLSNLIEDKIQDFFGRLNYKYYFVADNTLELCREIVGDPKVVSNYLLVPGEKTDQYLEGFRITEIDKKVFV
jgi:FkbM family methyltransferase